MEYVLYIGVPALVILLILIAYISTRPAAFSVERSLQINAPATTVFSIINDFTHWRRWSPFERDPNMKTTQEGPPSGPGSSYTWDGNNKVGSGRMTITESKPGELVAMDLEFTRPFKCNNQVRFTMTPAGDGTRVAWIMSGRNNFVLKAFSLFMNMDKMIGKDFETGLANLNAVVTGQPKPAATC